MKILGYILLASLTCALSACEKDEILPEPEPPVVTPGDDDGPEGDDPGKDEEEKIQLGITASLQAMQQTRGIIEAFLPGHEMGVFISAAGAESPYVHNVPYAFDGKNGMPAGTLRWRTTRRWPLICRTTDRRQGTGSSPLNWRTSTTSCMEGHRSPGTFRQRILR